MNKVIAELIGFTLTVQPEDNNFLSYTLFVKYSILHKIAIANWLPRLHISSVPKELSIQLFLVGTGQPFDIGKVIYQVIMNNAKFEHAYGVLPFPSLIFELL